MSLDVNKIIQESLNESVIATGEAVKRSAQASLDALKGGSAADEAEAAKIYAAKAIQKAKEENPGLLEKAGKSSEEISEKLQSAAKKTLGVAKEHPGVATGVAAAIAAGLGALALRKHMKKMKKE